MGDLVTITTTGRVTADVELKTSTNGKNTKYVQFGLAVNKGYGEHERPNFFSCVLYGEAAQVMLHKVSFGAPFFIVISISTSWKFQVLILQIIFSYNIYTITCKYNCTIFSKSMGHSI